MDAVPDEGMFGIHKTLLSWAKFGAGSSWLRVVENAKLVSKTIELVEVATTASWRMARNKRKLAWW